MSAWDDVVTLAKTIHGEARGESFEGQVAVAYVVKNRAKQRQASVRDICLQPLQFSAWNSGDVNLPILARLSFDDPGFIGALGVAGIVLANKVTDPTGGAVNYHTVAKPDGVEVWPPKWAARLVPTTRIGAHQFYRET